jgi:hypothetical protein
MINVPESAAQPLSVRVRKKYRVTAHKGFTVLISNWVKSHLGNLTIEEAAKKLSFIITAANEDLNAGVNLTTHGLEVVDDIPPAGRKQSSSYANV